MRCIWCNTPRSYYLTEENSMRQNCRVSDSGYHEFQSTNLVASCFRSCFGLTFVNVTESLLDHRRISRPNTI